MIFLVISIIIVLDQLVKYLVRVNFYISESIPVIDDIFHLTYVRNKGAAFGILQGHILFFIIISVLIIGFLIFYRYKNPKYWMSELALGLIIGGAIGNFIDRVVLGYVVDYLDFRIWPVFNIADSAVVIGVSIFVIYMWKLEQVT